MFLRFLFPCTIFALLILSTPTATQAGILDSAHYQESSLLVRDVVYDRIRDVLYATDSLHNEIATIDPYTGNVLDSIAVGNQPNQLAISDDGSRVYVGLDTDNAFRWWQPSDNTLGPLRTLAFSDGGPAVAESLAVTPGKPGVVVVSKNEIGTTQSGKLEVFSDSDSQPVSDFYSNNNLVSFVNQSTMISFNNSNSSNTTRRWNLSGLDLTVEAGFERLATGGNTQAEANADGTISYSEGTVGKASDLTKIGTFLTRLQSNSSMVEYVPALSLTYFVGKEFSSGAVAMRVFDSSTFAELDSIPLPLSYDDVSGKVIIAGENRLAFIAREKFPGLSRVLSIVSDIPVSLVPGPSSMLLMSLAGMLFGCRMRCIPIRRCAHGRVNGNWPTDGGVIHLRQ